MSEHTVNQALNTNNGLLKDEPDKPLMLGHDVIPRLGRLRHIALHFGYICLMSVSCCEISALPEQPNHRESDTIGPILGIFMGDFYDVNLFF